MSRAQSGLALVSRRGLVQNFVNLGNFYSLQPWQTSPRFRFTPKYNAAGLPRHRVNLGKLYRATANLEYLQPQGWAYFEDGSVFVARHNYDHCDFQGIMNLAAYFVRDPSDAKAALDRKDHHQMQMIMVEKPSSPNFQVVRRAGQFHIYVRYAQSGKTLSDPSQTFYSVRLRMDPTRAFPISIALKGPNMNSGEIGLKQKSRLLDSLQTFRGTLIDGALQPNVRLSNGLKFLIGPPRVQNARAQAEGVHQQKASEQKHANQVENPISKLRLSECRPQTSHQEHRTSVSHQSSSHTGTEQTSSKNLLCVHDKIQNRERAEMTAMPGQNLERKQYNPDVRTKGPALAARLDAGERELVQKEELLRWKKKTWELKQEQVRINNSPKLQARTPRAGRVSSAVDVHKDESVPALPVDRISEANTRPPGQRVKIRKHVSSKGPTHRESADPDSFFELLNHDDTMPTNALALLRDRSRWHSK